MSDHQMSNLVLDREMLSDLASIKLAELEQTLKRRDAEIGTLRENNSKRVKETKERLQNAALEAARAKYLSKLQTACSAINALDIFPEFAPEISLYKNSDLCLRPEGGTTKEKDTFGVSICFVVPQTEQQKRLASVGLTADQNLTTIGKMSRNDSGARIVLSASAVVEITEEIRNIDAELRSLDEERVALEKEQVSVASALRDMNSSERLLKAKIAEKSLSASEGGKQALSLLDGLSIDELTSIATGKQLPPKIGR